MRAFLPLIALAAAATAAPALADHILNLETPYPTRGACESAAAQFATDDRASLLDRFPNFFSRNGDVAAFLARAFPCEYDSADGNWYIQDRRVETLNSEWFLRRP